MARFRLLVGRHSRGRSKDGSRQVFNKGDIIVAKNAVEEKFFKKYKNKFELIQESVPVMSARKPAPKEETKVEVEADEGIDDDDDYVDVVKLKEKLSGMSAKQLQATAKEFNVNIQGIVNKQDMIKVISEALDKLAETAD